VMPICVHNLCSGDEVTYSLPLLVGDVQSFTAQGHIVVKNCNQSISWPIVNGRFKALVELIPGRNNIELGFCDELLVFVLHLKFPSFTYFVRPIYIKCHGDSGEFQGPDEEDCSSNSAVERISLAARCVFDVSLVSLVNN
jgi:Putative peptidase family